MLCLAQVLVVCLILVYTTSTDHSDLNSDRGDPITLITEVIAVSAKTMGVYSCSVSMLLWLTRTQHLVMCGIAFSTPSATIVIL